MEQWDKALKAAQETLIEDLTHVKDVEIWLVGSALKGSDVENLSLNARITFSDDGVEKLRYNMTPKEEKALETPDECMEWCLMYLVRHLIVGRFHSKLKED